MADKLRAAAEQALEALQHLAGMNCDHSRGICVCEYREAANNLSAALAQQAEQAEPVAFDPNKALRLADEYAEAAHQFHHRVDEARAKLAAYLGIKGGGNG